MNKSIIDDMLLVSKVEGYHQQRVDGIWTQFKDAMIALHGMVFAILGSLSAASILDPGSRMALIAFTVLIDVLTLYGFRRDVERSASAVQSDYAVEYRLATGREPPRPLYSRAFKVTKTDRRSRDGVSIMGLDREDIDGSVESPKQVKNV